MQKSNYFLLACFWLVLTYLTQTTPVCLAAASISWYYQFKWAMA